MSCNEATPPNKIEPHVSLAVAYISLNEVDLLLSVVSQCNKIGQWVHVFMDSRTDELELMKLEHGNILIIFLLYTQMLKELIIHLFIGYVSIHI